MGAFLFLSEFFIALFLLFLIGGIIGHIFHLDEYLKYGPDHFPKEDP